MNQKEQQTAITWFEYNLKWRQEYADLKKISMTNGKLVCNLMESFNAHNIEILKEENIELKDLLKRASKMLPAYIGSTEIINNDSQQLYEKIKEILSK